MTKTVTTYQCDICGAEFTEKEKLKVAHVPGRGCDSEGYPMGYEDFKLDLCDECRKKLLEAVENNFAKVLDQPGGMYIVQVHR